MVNYRDLEGSGSRAFEANQEAMLTAQQQLQALEQRIAQGEILDKEVKQALEHINRLKEDKGRIESAGI